jgi:TonB family protein
MKKKTFLHYPEYPGGKVTCQKYLSDNQVYPEEAQKNNIEGIVYLSADVNDNGQVTDIRIEKGIGYGCDEEAFRLLQGMHFGSVFNRGLRMKTRKKFRIPFKMKKEKENMEIKYTLKKNDHPEVSIPKPATSGNPYSYTIQWLNQEVQNKKSNTP